MAAASRRGSSGKHCSEKSPPEISENITERDKTDDERR